MFQQIIVIGHLGRDPEMRFAPDGKPVANFSVATSRQYTGRGGEQVKETTWFRVSAWDKLGENCNQFLHKGSKVMVLGRLIADPKTGGPRIWQRQDGTAGNAFEILASQVRFLSDRRADESGAVEYAPVADEDEIPF
jgi:single-strand DNA-binding protein